MTIGDFIKSTKVIISNDLINYVIDGFLKSNLAFYKPNSSLMLYLENDKKNRGKVSEAQINDFVNRLMLDRLKSKYGERRYFLVPQEEKINDSREEIEKINDIFKKNSFISITKDGVIGAASLKYDHTFIVNTKPEDYVEVLSVFYELVRDFNLDNTVICACSPNYAGLGYTAPIKINCSVEVLAIIVDLFDHLKHTVTSKTIKVLPIYDRMNTWYGYDQYDSHNEVEASAIFTMAVFKSMQKTFDAYLDQSVEIDGVLIKDYYENKSNKVQAMRDIINNSIALEDALITNIILNTRNELSSFGLTTTNILNVPAVEARMEDYYKYELLSDGEDFEPEIAADGIINEMVLNQDIFIDEKSDLEGEVIPVTTDIVMEEESSLEEIIEDLDQIVLSSEESDLSEEDIFSDIIEETPSEEEINLPDEEVVIESSSEEESDLSEGDISSDIIEETSGEEDITLADDEVQSAEVIETVNEVSENEQAIIEKTAEQISLEELHNPDKLELVNPESNCLEYQLKDGLLIPDLADIAYTGDSLIEALRYGGYQTDFDYICSVAAHFNYNYEGSTEDKTKMLDILRNLPKYYFDGTPKEGVKSVDKVLETKEEKLEESENLVLRTSEEARDESVISSLDGEIERAVQDVLIQMRQAASEIPNVVGISEVTEEQYQNLVDQEKIDDTSLEINGDKNLDEVNDGHYYVNADYLMQFAGDFEDKKNSKEGLSSEEVEALKNTSIATLSDSINRLVDTIQIAEEAAKKEQEIIDPSDERLAKYAYLVDDLSNLKKKIKNSDKTVLEYFEAEEIEKNVQGNEILIYHDHSRKTIKQFINENLINYLVNFGSHELSYILSLYADSIEQDEVIKK